MSEAHVRVQEQTQQPREETLEAASVWSEWAWRPGPCVRGKSHSQQQRQQLLWETTTCCKFKLKAIEKIQRACWLSAVLVLRVTLSCRRRRGASPRCWGGSRRLSWRAWSGPWRPGAGSLGPAVLCQPIRGQDCLTNQRPVSCVGCSEAGLMTRSWSHCPGVIMRSPASTSAVTPSTGAESATQVRWRSGVRGTECRQTIDWGSTWSSPWHGWGPPNRLTWKKQFWTGPTCLCWDVGPWGFGDFGLAV